MKVKFAKWGNSIALQIPSEMAEALAITFGSSANINVTRGKLIITPQQDVYLLDELLAALTEENLHQEASTGNSMRVEMID